MLITGSGITPFVFRTDRDITTNTKLAIDWSMCSDNNYYATDWGSNSDVYESTVTTYGDESYINNIIVQINNNRVSGNYILYMQDVAEDEKIFGQDVDTTIMSGVVTNLSVREATSWKIYKLTMDIRALGPQFSTVDEFNWSGQLCVGFQHTTGRTWDINKYDTYDSVLYIYDHLADEGVCKFVLNVNNDQLASLRQFRRTNRGSSFVLPSGALGITYPFGPRSSAGPHNVKLLDMTESRISPFRHNVEITLSEFI